MRLRRARPMHVSRVFISYRRDDTSVHADRLHARLQRHYGIASAFIDRVSIHPGEDFVSKVDETIRSCDAVLLLIGKGFTRTEVDRQRLDYVHIELRAALDRRIRVFPLLLDGAQMPDVDGWPKDLVVMTRRHGHTLSVERWRRDVDTLVRALEADPNPPWSRHLEHRSQARLAEKVLKGRHRDMSYRCQPDVIEVARALAQWLRRRGLIAQVLHTPNYVVVECMDESLWRRFAGESLGLSIFLMEDADDIGYFRVLTRFPGVWTDQSIPEGVAKARELEISDDWIKAALGAGIGLIPGLRLAWGLLGAGLMFLSGQSRFKGVDEVYEFLEDLLGMKAQLRRGSGF
jgi:hypothetical protein